MYEALSNVEKVELNKMFIDHKSNFTLISVFVEKMKSKMSARLKNIFVGYNGLNRTYDFIEEING